MTPLERRDRRRAFKLVHDIGPMLGWPAVAAIAGALKREREETGMAAATFFLFSDKNTRAKVKRHVQKSKSAAFAFGPRTFKRAAPKGEKG